MNDNLKEEYHETYDVTRLMLDSFKNMFDKKEFIMTRMESYNWASKFKWKGEHYWKNVVATAQYRAIMDHQRSLKLKGFNIYGIKI